MFSVDQGINQKKKETSARMLYAHWCSFPSFPVDNSINWKNNQFISEFFALERPIFRELRDWKYNLLYTILTVD